MAKSRSTTTDGIVLLYGRASSDPDDQRISVDRQLKLGRQRARDLWPDAEVREFRDDNITAADPGVERPGYNAFLAELRAARPGEVRGVVVNEQSRLTRQPAQWEELIVALTRSGVEKIETLRAGPVGVTEGSRLVGRMLALIDAEEVERTRARVLAAHRELFESGRPAGRAPYGYQRARDATRRPAFVQDPAEANVVADIFRWFAEGQTLRGIADRLNAAGVPPRSAAWTFREPRAVPRWKPYSVRSVLQTPSMAGLRAHTDADGVVHTRPGTWEGIVSEDTWRSTQRVLGQLSVVTAPNGKTYRVRTQPAPTARRYLLSGGSRRGLDGTPEVYGVLRCGKCGTPMAAQTQQRRNGPRVPAYQCHPKTSPDACGGVSISPAEEIEAWVVTVMQDELRRSPKLRARLAAGQDAEVARLRAERESAKATMLDAGRLRGEGQIDQDVWVQMHQPAKARYDRADIALKAATSEVDLPGVADVLDNWDGLTLKQQRAVVDRLVESIEIAPASAYPNGRPGFNAARLGQPKWRR